MRIFGKGKCKFIANFSAAMVTSLRSLSLSLSHRKYLTHNIGSASYNEFIYETIILAIKMANESKLLKLSEENQTSMNKYRFENWKEGCPGLSGHAIPRVLNSIAVLVSSDETTEACAA